MSEEKQENLAPEMVLFECQEDQEEKDFLERLMSFGEGYFDFTNFAEIFGEIEVEPNG